jgi:small GTP-binding protein
MNLLSQRQEEFARRQFEFYENSRPDVFSLALLASPARKIEPELLRLLRLKLSDYFPGERKPNVGSESALWFSALVESRGADAITLLPGVLDLLRRRLVEQHGELLEKIREIIHDCHRSIPPVIRWEEDLIYYSLTSTAGNDYQDVIRETVLQAAKAVKSGERKGLEEWICGMYLRIPEELLNNDSFKNLLLISQTQSRKTKKLTDSSDFSSNSVDATLKIKKSESEIEIGNDLTNPNFQVSVPKILPITVVIGRSSEPSQKEVRLIASEGSIRIPYAPNENYLTLEASDGRIYKIPCNEPSQQPVAHPLNEAKVLVAGEANVGKTSLILRLIMGEYDPKRNPTGGIQIYKEWKVPVNDQEVQLNIWDFGGQEIMHATHQFFLTTRSLYILVLDARIGEEDNRIEYWLENIRILGANPPVIVVINKIDLHQPNINQSRLIEHYPNIKGFYFVSCERNIGLYELKNALINEVGQLSGIHDPLPASWFAVKEELEKFDADFISNDKYEEICREQNVNEEDSERLLSLLHDLGVVLSFRDDVNMQDTSVLNPEWVTQGVYAIINSIELFKTKGVLTREMLKRILDEKKYPVKNQLFIVEMMKKFELCFEIKTREEFLVPDLLSEEELNTGNWDNSLRFEYQYNILFGSIITRFIVKMHHSISKKTYWRTGVVLEYVINGRARNEALVKADTVERKIIIAIRGNENTRREFLSRIREKFEEIHNSFPIEFKENVAERVPIPNYPEISIDYQHLRNLEEMGEGFVIPERLSEQFSVKDLLNGIEPEAERIRDKVGLPLPNRSLNAEGEQES